MLVTVRHLRAEPGLIAGMAGSKMLAGTMPARHTHPTSATDSPHTPPHPRRRPTASAATATLLEVPDPMTTPRPPLSTPTALMPTALTLGDVVARIAAEVSAPLTAALDRVATLTSTGQIDRPGLQALRMEIDSARRVGLRGQQIARLASGQVRQSMERLDLPHCLRAVLQGQLVHADGGAIATPPPPTKAEVLGDASLLHAVLDAAANWSGALARATVEWRIDVKPWPVRARVICRFAHVPADHAAAGNLALDRPGAQHGAAAAAHHASKQTTQHATQGANQRPIPHDPPHSTTDNDNALDTLDWLLLNFTAHIAGVLVQRQDSASHSQLTLEFLNTVNGTLEGAAAIDLVASAEGGAQSIAGCQMLVLASQRSTRQRLREAVQGLDLLTDHVSTVADASLYCREGAPQMLVFESAFQGDALTALLAQLTRGAPGVVLIELLPSGQDCELSVAGVSPVTRLGIDALHSMLLPVLLLEMGRAGVA